LYANARVNALTHEHADAPSLACRSCPPALSPPVLAAPGHHDCTQCPCDRAPARLATHALLALELHRHLRDQHQIDVGRPVPALHARTVVTGPINFTRRQCRRARRGFDARRADHVNLRRVGALEAKLRIDEVDVVVDGFGTPTTPTFSPRFSSSRRFACRRNSAVSADPRTAFIRALERIDDTPGLAPALTSPRWCRLGWGLCCT